jgi:hypothetical protein
MRCECLAAAAATEKSIISYSPRRVARLDVRVKERNPTVRARLRLSETGNK